MCSIFAVLDLKTDPMKLQKKAIELSGLMRHRGPDCFGLYASDHAILAHERLSIVDIKNGAQPLYNAAHTQALAVNGEIYNHQELRRLLKNSYKFQTSSDCEVILALYAQKGSDFLNDLNGMFAFIIYDADKQRYLIGRDHLGIIPLYMGYDEHSNFYLASEMKALIPICCTIKEFPPGSYMSSEEGKIHRYYYRNWFKFENIKYNISYPHQVKNALEDAVRNHLMSEVPYGVLLSGGLDSSIIAAITKKFMTSHAGYDQNTAILQSQLHSFAVGLEDSPDLKAAHVVAKHLGIIHHEINFTIEEGLDAIRDVIYHIETYDVTTIRASVPMYLMARRIKDMGIKMVLSGEGADEVFGGYLYFHKAPNSQEFHEETVRKLLSLHKYDCVRANKSMSAWGLEARVPFLDKKFLDVAMSLNPKDKMCGNGKIEKYIMRKCFSSYLPHSIAWRQKEQFSDGVGYTWIDILKNTASQQISNKMLSNAHEIFPYNTPLSKEGYLYRKIFAEMFPVPGAAECVPIGRSVACSSGRAAEWDESFRTIDDPSGRSVSTHQHAYKT
ncbi:asparagine synthase B [Candidatus Profftia tarda]|uniref:asparagine synthase (glutamine-hydrolyzing) n=1 Tax=Candidatus Profftia tarda TaxID=1177216 RepID=A0A8E4MEV3_9ENTR|nr:asparagine synthase B [Candidatus Profftia tarda]CAD6509745.1 Asparagine synthetase B [Candidatus Profftia tarda]